MKAFVGLVALLLLVACASQAPEITEENKVMEGSEVQEPEVAGGSMMDIATAMQGSGAKCVTSVEGQTSTMYMKGGMMRMDTMPANAHGIYTEDIMYSWSGKQGMMMKRADLEAMAAEATANVPEYKSSSDIAQENPDVECTPFDVVEDMFNPPNDVEFQDFGAMMAQLKAQMPDISQYQ